MDPISAMIGGGASLLGSIFSSETSAQNTQANIMAQQAMQQQTQQFNAQQAQINRDYQTTMSNTAYERASADMKAAGLNPMMMFGSGAAASSPGGASASVGTPNMALSQKVSPFANFGDVVSKALSTAQNVQDFQRGAYVKDQAAEQARGEKARADAAEATAEQERLKLPQHRLDALEAETRLGLPKEDIAAHATSAYKYGEWGEKVAKPFFSVTTGLNKIVDGLVNQITGPTGKSMWDLARQSFGPGGKVVDTKDFPRFYKDTGMDAQPGR